MASKETTMTKHELSAEDRKEIEEGTKGHPQWVRDTIMLAEEAREQAHCLSREAREADPLWDFHVADFDRHDERLQSLAEELSRGVLDWFTWKNLPGTCFWLIVLYYCFTNL